MPYNLFNTGQKKILENFGPDVRIINVPTILIDIIPPTNLEDLKTCLAKKPVLVFQSKNAVAGFSRWMENDQDAEKSFSQIYSTGNQTAKAVQKFLLLPSKVPNPQNASGLLSELKKGEKQPILLVTGTLHRHDVLNGLTEDGWDITHVKVYNTLPAVNYDLRSRFSNSPNDIIFFSSPSTVEGFLESTDMADLGEVKSKILSIGPTTTSWIQKKSGLVYAEASVPDVSIAITTILTKLKKTKSTLQA